MAHKVTNMLEVKYMCMSEKERKEIWRLDDLRAEQICTCFDDDGDYFALYKDLDASDRESNDDRTYAVYAHKSGDLLCLLSDAGSALEGFKDFEYGYKRNELYKQIAMLAGWPEKLPHHMTWRELIDILQTKYKDALDDPVHVWVPKDDDFDEFPYISDVSPYDMDDKAGYWNNNPLSITVQGRW